MTQQPTDSNPSLSVLRIYLRRRSSKPGRGFWGRLFGRSPPTTLPSCVELVAPADVLEAFVTANHDELVDAVLLRLDGARVTLRGGSA